VEVVVQRRFEDAREERGVEALYVVRSADGGGRLK
jgi:hypothetical protein